MNDTDKLIDLDDLAVQLAAENGDAWQDLCDFPGYKRNIWREEARSELLRLVPDAVIEVRPATWNGRDAGYVARIPRKD
jgi:hypothetical protein